MIPQLSDCHPLSVLIADAFEDAAESLACLLELCGHNVTVAASGEAALAAAAESPPDVVILELRLPGLNGWEVARQLRTMEPRPLCIAVTTCARAADRQRSAAAGIGLHLLKPTEPAALVALLARFAQTRRGQLQPA